ncbi:MAG: LPS export ABC transporter periplasmic protein LptC [Thermodesulfovibrionales bacterium]|nr:LPS export ABC transporter periplasmic protein LptC [Thermodesulfovibrionales bacterium]
MKRFFFIFSVIALSVALAVSFNNEKQELKLQFGTKSFMDDVKITHKKNNMTKWELHSQKATFLSDKDVELANLKITFPEKGLVLTSDKGMYNIESRDLKIDDNIRASTEDYEIVAKTLFWDSSKNELFSDGKVMIVGKKFFIEGNALAATTDKAKLNNNVKAVFYGE